MKPYYDFNAGVRNPYTKRVKRAVTLRLETDVVNYFKGLSGETGIPYQNLINLYLRDCAEHSRKLDLVWTKKGTGQGS